MVRGVPARSILREARKSPVRHERTMLYEFSQHRLRNAGLRMNTLSALIMAAARHLNLNRNPSSWHPVPALIDYHRQAHVLRKPPVKDAVRLPFGW